VKAVFISYCRTDEEFVQHVKRELSAAGIQTWQDRDIEPGRYWQADIDTAIRDAGAMVLVLSPSALESEYVNYEWAFALGAGLSVIPILYNTELSEIRHGALQLRQSLNFTDVSNRDWKALVQAVQREVRARSEAVARMPFGTGSIVTPSGLWADNEFFLVNVATNKCADVYRALRADDVRIIQYPLHGAPNQIWSLVPTSEKAFKFVPKLVPTKCISPADNAGVPTRLVQKEYTSGRDQQWVLQKRDDSTFRIQNAAHELCLAVEDGATRDGADLVQDYCSGKANQRWLVVPNPR